MAKTEMKTETAPVPAAGSPSQPDVGGLSFEKALAELEAIVGKLEKGSVPLEESIAIYERGEVLKRHCEALLQRAEARIERITLGADGRPTGTAPLDPPDRCGGRPCGHLMTAHAIRAPAPPIGCVV